MTKGITNITKYRSFSLGQRYNTGNFTTLSFLRSLDKATFSVYINGEYRGQRSFSDTYYLVRQAYDRGFKTLEKQQLL